MNNLARMVRCQCGVYPWLTAIFENPDGKFPSRSPFRVSVIGLAKDSVPKLPIFEADYQRPARGGKLELIIPLAIYGISDWFYSRKESCVEVPKLPIFKVGYQRPTRDGIPSRSSRGQP